MNWKRRLAATVANTFGIEIVRRGNAWMTVEADVIRRSLEYFHVDCVFDVGANAGQYARLLRSIGYVGAIVSFEPIPSFVAKLRDAAARDANWFVEPFALDEQETQKCFNVMASSEFSSLHAPNHAESPLFQRMNVVVETIEVQTLRLDGLFDRYREKLGFRRPFLKMDTQGNDLAVARGAGDRLAQFVGLQSELAIKRIYEDQCVYRDAIAWYEAQGFVLSSFVPNNAGHFPDLVEIDCVMYNRRIGQPLAADVARRTDTGFGAEE